MGECSIDELQLATIRWCMYVTTYFGSTCHTSHDQCLEGCNRPLSSVSTRVSPLYTLQLSRVAAEDHSQRNFKTEMKSRSMSCDKGAAYQSCHVMDAARWNE